MLSGGSVPQCSSRRRLKMNSHPVWWAHFVYAAFFAAGAVYMVVNGRYTLNARCAWAGLRVAAGDGSSDDERIESAIKRRQIAEGPPAPIGLYTAAVMLLIAVLAALNIGAPTQMYSLFCIATPLIAAAAFLRLRNLQPTRAAVLSVRTSDSVIPSYWFVAAAISALLVLSFASDPAYALAAGIVCAASLMTIYIAWRMTLLPAMLTGVDVPAEQLVDDRLRFNRSTMPLFYALVQTFAFCMQFRSVNSIETAAYYVSLLWVVFMIWTTLWRARPVRLA
jgi:hypothetical protein